jgi:hypothetical protein
MNARPLHSKAAAFSLFRSYLSTLSNEPKTANYHQVYNMSAILRIEKA